MLSYSDLNKEKDCFNQGVYVRVVRTVRSMQKTYDAIKLRTMIITKSSPVGWVGRYIRAKIEFFFQISSKTACFLRF